jgi:hypothetical protein
MGVRGTGVLIFGFLGGDRPGCDDVGDVDREELLFALWESAR